MKNQASLSSKNRSKKLKCRLLQFLFGALWVKFYHAAEDFSINFTKHLGSFQESLTLINQEQSGIK